MHAHPFCVHPPIECLVATDDDVLLSPTQEEETEFIAFLMYKEYVQRIGRLPLNLMGIHANRDIQRAATFRKSERFEE